MSMIDGVTDWARLLNAVLACLVLVSMALQWRQWVQASRGGQLVLLGLGLLVAAVGWSAVETLMSPVTAPGVRTYVMTVALLWCLAGIWLDRPPKR